MDYPTPQNFRPLQTEALLVTFRPTNAAQLSNIPWANMVMDLNRPYHFLRHSLYLYDCSQLVVAQYIVYYLGQNYGVMLGRLDMI